MNIANLLDVAARRRPANAAVCWGDDTVLDHRSLRERAFRMASALRARFGAGARVALVSENRPEYIELMWALWAAEQVLVPVNSKLHPREIAFILQDAGASAVLASPAFADTVAAACADALPSVARIELSGRDYVALLDAAPTELPPTSPDHLAWLFYTSGTTGQPKGAMLTHRNLTAMTLAHLADIEAVDETCSLVHGAPMSHGSGLYIPAYVARAARQVVPRSGGFDPAEFLGLCDRHPGSGCFLAPTMVQRLRLYLAQGMPRPRHLRSIVYGGGPMYLEELKRSKAVFGDVFAQIYGQGESPMTITGLTRTDHLSDDDAVLRSVGCARTGVQVAVVDEAGQPVPAGTVGEVVCRGDVVMAGYWNQPQASTQSLRGGWLYTGDMGAMDTHGYLTLHDRSKDVVISGGSNIYPREVEEVLLGCPGVREACVLGRPDEAWGEVVVAFIVAEPDAAPSIDRLDRHCLAHIARFKRPKAYRFVDALPKNSYGKVLKRVLREQLLRESAPAN